MTRPAPTRIVVSSVVMMAATVAWLLACGPFLVDLKPVQTIAPAHLDSYARGELGVVRPRFARRFLVEAYRRMNGRPAISMTVKSPTGPAAIPAGAPIDGWEKARESVPNVPPAPRVEPLRRLPDYQWFDNCLDDAFVAAASTLKARGERYGLSGPQVRDWLRAQDAVFSNCAGEQLVLPEPAAASADPLARADRAYQTAAAYFYAMQFDEAGNRFRAIADDAASPWRGYGRYLAARSAIRAATVPDRPAAGGFAAAEADLRAVLQDPAARALHESARGLLDFIATRARPVERVRTLSATGAESSSVGRQQLRDYQWLMDRLLGDTTTFPFASIEAREALTKGDDFASWIIAMQGTGDDAVEHTLGEWRRVKSIPWLVAAHWKVPPSHAEVTSVLRAAADVSRDSPAGPTLAFLRVRLLARAGRVDDARALLATLPAKATAGFPPETVNLLNAERFMLATTLDELVRSAARLSVVDTYDEPEHPVLGETPVGKRLKPLTPVFDGDAGAVFSLRLPLSRLIEAAQSPALADARLRLRLATVAFTRVILLQRFDEAVRLVPVLRRHGPALAKDLDAFERAAAPDARHRAGIAVLLRTPGLHAHVQGIEDDAWFMRGEAARTFDHVFRRNWWCAFDQGDAADAIPSEATELLFGSSEVPAPSFLTAADRAAAARERTALAALGPGPNYLADEAVKWARARPQDPEAAEMLALAVEGTRWGCTDARTTAASRRAFQTLHRLFPKTEWARRTKYWY